MLTEDLRSILLAFITAINQGETRAYFCLDWTIEGAYKLEKMGIFRLQIESDGVYATNNITLEELHTYINLAS